MMVRGGPSVSQVLPVAWIPWGPLRTSPTPASQSQGTDDDEWMDFRRPLCPPARFLRYLEILQTP